MRIVHNNPFRDIRQKDMSSVLYQSFNSNGSPALRNDINGLRNQLTNLKKDMDFLLKVLSEKSPEVVDEYNRLKNQEAELALAAAAPPPPSQNNRNAVNSLRR